MIKVNISYKAIMAEARRKKNLLFISRYNPFTSCLGTEILVGNLALEMSKQGHSVHIIFEDNLPQKDDKEINGVVLHDQRITDLTLIRAFSWRERCAKICPMVMKDSNIDAIISFGAGALGGYTFKKINGQLNDLNNPVRIYYAMDTMEAEYKRTVSITKDRSLIRMDKIKYKWLLYSDIQSCNYSDIILSTSADTKRGLETAYGIPSDKIKIIYNGILDDYASGVPIVDPIEPTFLHVGGVPRKGTIYFLRALELLRSKYGLSAKGNILRPFPSDMDLAKSMNLNIEWFSNVDIGTVRRLYAETTAFVSPSLSEGFCLPIIEAAAFGKISIVYNVGSLPELVRDGENGFIVPAPNVDALAEKMYLVATNQELRKRMGAEAKRMSANFTISKLADRLLNYI